MIRPGSEASALLLGREHTEYGELATQQVAPGVVLGLTRGAYPKGYPYVDPNEDAAFAAVAGPAALLAVADGHNGIEAAEAAVGAVEAEALELLRSTNPLGRLGRLLEQARSAVVGATAALEPPRAGSGTALAVALVAGPDVVVGAAGDAVVVRLGRRRKAVLTGRHRPFLTARSAAGCFRVESHRLVPGEGLVLLTDGIYGFLGRDWSQRVADAAEDHADAADLVVTLVEAAARGGAGDNGAVAVYRPRRAGEKQ